LKATKSKVPTQADFLLTKAVERSKRSSGIQLLPEFVKALNAGEHAPVGLMLRGGRGGEVRLKLYLTMVLVATRSPHEIREVPARVWAEMLGLDDPEVLGARRVSDALDWLNKKKFIQLTSKRGTPPTVRLLSAAGDGTDFARGRGQYLRVPLGIWEHKWIVLLSGRELALLLVLLDLQGGRDKSNPPSLPGELRRRSGLSDDTWARATAELKARSLLTVKKKPHEGPFVMKRLRNTYWVHTEVLSQPISKAAKPGRGH
jgi:hypothetical protein